MRGSRFEEEKAMTSLGAQIPTWVLICKRRFTMNGVLYNTGCLIDVVAFSAARNWSFLLQNRYAVFEPPNDNIKRPKATPLPPPAAAPPAQRPVAVVVAHSDPIISLGLSYLATAKAAGNNFGLARDLIEGAPGDLFQRAARIYAVRRGESFRRSVADLWSTALRLAEAA